MLEEGKDARIQQSLGQETPKQAATSINRPKMHEHAKLSDGLVSGGLAPILRKVELAGRKAEFGPGPQTSSGARPPIATSQNVFKYSELKQLPKGQVTQDFLRAIDIIGGFSGS